MSNEVNTLYFMANSHYFMIYYGIKDIESYFALKKFCENVCIKHTIFSSKQ